MCTMSHYYDSLLIYIYIFVRFSIYKLTKYDYKYTLRDSIVSREDRIDYINKIKHEFSQIIDTPIKLTELNTSDRSIISKTNLFIRIIYRHFQFFSYVVYLTRCLIKS